MTRTNNKPEPLARPIAMFVRASMLDKHSQLGTKQSLDPPARAARPGAASRQEPGLGLVPSKAG